MEHQHYHFGRPQPVYGRSTQYAVPLPQPVGYAAATAAVVPREEGYLMQRSSSHSYGTQGIHNHHSAHPHDHHSPYDQSHVIRKTGSRKPHGINLLWSQKDRFQSPYSEYLHFLLKQCAEVDGKPFKFRDVDLFRVRHQLKKEEKSSKTWRVWLTPETWHYYHEMKNLIAPRAAINSEFVELLLSFSEGSIDPNVRDFPRPTPVVSRQPVAYENIKSSSDSSVDLPNVVRTQSQTSSGGGAYPSRDASRDMQRDNSQSTLDQGSPDDLFHDRSTDKTATSTSPFTPLSAKPNNSFSPSNKLPFAASATDKITSTPTESDKISTVPRSGRISINDLLLDQSPIPIGNADWARSPTAFPVPKYTEQV